MQEICKFEDRVSSYSCQIAETVVVDFNIQGRYIKKLRLWHKLWFSNQIHFIFATQYRIH